MRLLFLTIFLDFLFNNLTADGNFWNWGPPQQPYVPNNNVAIGYPTAYGLYTGRGWGNNNYGGGPPNAGTGFGSPLRCSNGGAHIGQCRLDQDSICIALGGTCNHGACCTTPFVNMISTTTTTSKLIDGDTKRKTKRKGLRVTTPPSTPIPDEDDSVETDIPSEVDEWRNLVEQSKHSTTVEPVTVDHVNEERVDRKCFSGLRSIGPCSEDSDCPTLHQCEKEHCCFISSYL